MRFIDFAVGLFYVPDELEAQKKVINGGLFATYEPIRLWVRDHKVEAPFRKLAIGVILKSSGGREGASLDGSICHVAVEVDGTELRQKAGELRWGLGLIKRGLELVEQDVKWRSDEFDTHLENLASVEPPLVYVFESLARTDRKTETTLAPFFAAQPGLSQVGVRVQRDGTTKDVILVTKKAPLFLEEDFPVVKTAIKDGEFLLFDKAGKRLGSVPVAGPSNPKSRA